MNYSETYFELDSEEATHCDHCHLICCVYIKGMSRWSVQRIKAMLLCIEYGILFVDTVDTKIKACNALNAMFVETVDTTVKTYPHIPAHNFLNIQQIFNPQKVLESWTQGFLTIPSILYMSILLIQDKDL